MNKVNLVFVLITASAWLSAYGTPYHVDAITGSDHNDGLTRTTAWKTLKRASQAPLAPGDHLLLRRGQVFEGQLTLTMPGREDAPVRVSAYGPEDVPRPVIDAQGHKAGILLDNVSFVDIEDLEITADGGEPVHEEARLQRYGVYGISDHTALTGIRIRNLFIRDIFATEQQGSLTTRGRHLESNMGTGIFIETKKRGTFSDILVEGCRIERTGHTGIRFRGAGNDNLRRIRNVRVMNNQLAMIGGPGIQPSRVSGMMVRGNVVDHTGASSDPRMHARGSGIWPWSSDDVLIEHNRFKHARGIGDSCGVHIDYNCRDVVVQYNMSIDNEGGFIEVLGNNHNCTYRYNISVNDGFRVKNTDGAYQEGQTLWISGYVGKNPPVGPFNTYIYNNTIYTKTASRTCISVAPSAQGVLIANNIFHLLGTTENAAPANDWGIEGPLNVILDNNLYVDDYSLPSGLPFFDRNALFGDALFANPGGINPEDYVPANTAWVKDRGIPIEPLPDDPIGLRVGLAVPIDILGNPIVGRPDMGAIEIE